MKTESAVHFETATRIHIGLGVKDLQSAIAFYRTLFGHEPTKIKPQYAKFEVAEPPLNLTLNEGTSGPSLVGPASHFGVQVKSTQAVNETAERLRRAGYETRSEHQVSCCYALQGKVWVKDPDDNPWEVFVVLDNDVESRQISEEDCCAEGPCCEPGSEASGDRCCDEVRV